MKKKEVNTEGLSLSKQRKIEKQAEIAKKKKEELTSKIVWTAVAVLVVALIVTYITVGIIRKAKTIEPDMNFSAQLDEKGFIKKTAAADSVTLVDYKNITADMAELEYSDEDVDNDIQTVVQNRRVERDSEDLEAAMDDPVIIDYVGTVDGEEFEGGSDTDYKLVLGSGSFIDDFEDQIVGHHPGDEFDVEVTFPDPYEKNEDLSGKDAVFAVTLKSIYTVPEFTDEFVQENLSDVASTVEEYRQYLKDINFEDNLRDFAEEYVIENTTINTVPKAYAKQLKSNYKANDYTYYEYMNSTYQSYYGYTMYATFADYVKDNYEMTEAEYDANLEERIQDDLKYALACQAIAEKEGITATLEEAKDLFISEGGTEDDFANRVEAYGENYFIQQCLDEKVMEFVCGLINVE